MTEQEPNLEQQLEALKLAISNLEQESDPIKVLDQARDILSLMPDRPAYLLNDFMSQRRDLVELWAKAQTEEKKNEIKSRIKTGLDRMIQALEKRPHS